MKLDQRSEQNLAGVHPDLRRLVLATEPPHPIVIVEGLRNVERQIEYVENGHSETMNSRHLTGHAFDFAVFPKGPHNNVSWDTKCYKEVYKAFEHKAKQMNIPITWGGNWGSQDCMHIQLSWEHYPVLPPEKVKTRANSTTIAAAGGVGLASIIPPVMELLERADSPWLDYSALGVVLMLAGYIIRERLLKMDRDGV